MKALVTNAKNRIAYNILRSLAPAGVKVYCADFVPRAMSFYSRYSSGHFVYPSPFSKQIEFIDCLISKIKELNIDVLIPVNEELYLVAKHKDEMSRYVKMAVPDYSQILVAHNKDQWVPIAENLDIPVPRTLPIKICIANPALIAELSFPVLIKPRQGGGGWGIRRVGTADEFRKLLFAETYEKQPWERFIVQEMITGNTICVAMVFSQGRLRGKVAYQQIREYPAFGGQATCRISMSNKTAEDNFQKLLKHLEWHGVCQADFVVDKVTQIPYLIDINPRFWGSLAQGIASGVDFPYLLYQIALNGDVKPVEGFQEGVVTRWLGGELRGFNYQYLGAKRKLPFLREFFLSNSTKLYDDFSLGDPVPFFMWGVDALYRLMKFRKAQPHESLAGIWQ